MGRGYKQLSLEDRCEIARLQAEGRSIQQIDQPARHLEDIFDGAFIRGLVRLRRLGKAAQLADELLRRRADFLVGRRRVEVEQRADIAAHRTLPRIMRVRTRASPRRASPYCRARRGTGWSAPPLPPSAKWRNRL